jgi:hypothetical protein
MFEYEKLPLVAKRRDHRLCCDYLDKAIKTILHRA